MEGSTDQCICVSSGRFMCRRRRILPAAFYFCKFCCTPRERL
ncbi:hypothetical protein HMPREF1992_00472 [Selenomonas sp. oral taxon 892 str. F0426]|nr:hypothetical protein HMPREF1992_00472 [Selenomonas sp. oral taxon 892 str. F0426]